MNLSEALDAALPEIPQARSSRNQPPRLDPDLVIHETVLDGEPIVGVLKRGKNSYYRLSQVQWNLTKLFDGERSYAEIAEAFSNETGTPIEPDEVRSFAEGMEESGLWYETYQEKNLAMRDKLLAERGRRTKSKINIAHIYFSAWDPDQYFNWLDAAAGRFIYNGWSLLAALLLFTFETVAVVKNWSIIGPDTAMFFTFSEKSLGDLARFWVLILIVGFIHESAHGLTCKHYGGQVHSMGLMFLYLTPCFFVDVSETWISATKLQRLATIIAGIFIELVVCAIAMFFWLKSPAGSLFHVFMYEFILLTGIAAVAINLNPLLKLDGYYFLTEVIEQPELKERSTAFLSAWIQAKVLRLPVEIPIVPRRRVALYVIYSLLSGAYSYLLLYFVIRFSYRLSSKWFGEFALVLAVGLTFILFRSRLRSLRNVLKESWEQAVRKRFQSHRSYVVSGLVLIVALLFVPLWRDREDAYFVIEPGESQTICAAVPGKVNAVLVRQGEQVHAGQLLLQMTSYQAASMRASALANTQNARFRTFDAQLQGQSVGSAIADQVAAQRMTRLANEAHSSLELKAPADGTVLTENPALLTDADVGYGQPLIQLAEGSSMARIFIPATELERVMPGSEVALALPGQFALTRLKLGKIMGEPIPLPAGIVASEKYKGLQLPVFYSALIPIPTGEGNPMYGLSGKAIVFGARRSIAGRFAMAFSSLIKTHFWW